ncbi:MAG TPA: YceI family protein [Kofleriaceae bacterium]|jgi:polyisoprenoid-binding protein YceI
MKTIALLVLATALAFVPGCGKPRSDTPSTATGSAANADHITVLARHRPAKPTDPVQVRFDKFRVVSASFDPKTIEGGTATIEIDLASLASGSGERDEDLRSPRFIDVATFATLTIEITNVKKKQDKTFTADATVKLRGVTKTYPVTFDVVEQRDDGIRIRGEHTFSRLDFAVGTDPAQDPHQQVDTELTIEMLLTIKKS